SLSQPALAHVGPFSVPSSAPAMPLPMGMNQMTSPTNNTANAVAMSRAGSSNGPTSVSRDNLMMMMPPRNATRRPQGAPAVSVAGPGAGGVGLNRSMSVAPATYRGGSGQMQYQQQQMHHAAAVANGWDDKRSSVMPPPGMMNMGSAGSMTAAAGGSGTRFVGDALAMLDELEQREKGNGN
ncbi:hypothetical protein HDU76_011243, partial [Blyttiomyces sp. JEL0837]